MTIATDHFSVESTGVRRLMITVEQYDRMLETGIIESGSAVELIDGMLVAKDRSARGEDPMTVGTAHRWAVQALVRHLSAVGEMGCELQTQQPIALPPHGEPEPDAAIVADASDQYRNRKPGPNDVHCVIEVSDSSLEHDRTTKLRTYAAAGIPQYVILNLVESVIEVYSDPERESARYRQAEQFAAKQPVSFSAGHVQFVTLAAELLLP